MDALKRRLATGIAADLLAVLPAHSYIAGGKTRRAVSPSAR
jgi:hypothetical protein